MENKELLALLRERGFEVKSASSTIDNISAESLVEEFAAREEAEPGPEESVEAPAEGSETKPAGPKFPEGAFVKTAEDIEREKREKAEAEAKRKAEESAARAPAPTPAPEAPKPAAPEPPKPAPAPPKAPPAPPSGGSRPPMPAGPPKPPSPAPSGPPRPPSPSGPPKPPAQPVPPNPETKDAAEPGSADAPGSDAPEAASDEAPEASEAPKVIHAKPPIVVRDFAVQIGLKPFKLISELMEMGIFASMNQTIEENIATQVASRHGFTLEVHHRGEGGDKPAAKKEEKPDEDDPKFLEPRPPVCCILGHVDHGKTTLLDTIRKENVAEGEAGGITQHIGAYQIEHNDQKITFIDTPGHAAFSMMRSRGANVTDIAILIIAADDGFMPQTEEALRFAKAANNAIVVAINKCDAKGANVDRVKQQMQEKGIQPEDWGGETVTVEISALKGENIDELLDMILLQAEVLELKANPTCAASGTIIESQIEQGRGSVASVIVEKGTLKRGDALRCGEAYCRVKSMMDENGNIVKEATPATPVRIIGWSGTPKSGSKFVTEKNEKAAKRAAEEAAQERKRAAAAPADDAPEKKPGGATVEDLFAAIESQKKKCLRVIVKSDVHGSAEALVTALEAIDSDKVDLDVVSYGVGNITKNDIALASAGGSCIVGFNVRLDNGVQALAKHHDVHIIQHDIIYELLNLVEEEMAGMLDAELRESKLGAAEVRQVFGVGKGRNVAGCMVTEGTINRNRKARLLRGGELLYEGKINTLRRFKDDVREVRAGYECGINIEGYNDYREGDLIECIEVEEIRASL